VYDHKKKKGVDTIDFRETAPLTLPTAPLAAGDGSAFVGVPGFLRGLHAVHEAHGLLSWSEVIDPSIHLAR
jgi:gamma-glutamyltranspeptidase